MPTDEMKTKQDNLRKQAEQADHDSQIARAEQEVEDRKRLAKEAREFADDAMARDGGGITVDQPGAEAERTRILAEQAERDLADAENYLKELRAGNENATAPKPSQLQPGVGGQGGSRAATTTENVNSK